ncbi:MAG: GTPase [Candidatus Diapherotrites archaeon]
MSFARRVFKIVRESDIVLEVVDARFPKLMRNAELEGLALRYGKKLVIVLNKSDLVSKRKAEKEKNELEKAFPAVFVSAPKKQGMGQLRTLLGGLVKGKKAKVAVVGYPNTGKSSVINALAGRRAAGVGAEAGHTKGEQWVKISEDVVLLDSPGIIPFEEKDEFALCLMGAKRVQSLQDVEGAGIQFVNWLQQESPSLLKELGGNSTDAEQALEEIAFKHGKLQKGGIADLKATSSWLLQQWQKGRFKL